MSYSRRGSVYVLVLGAVTMIAVVGLSAIAVSRADTNSAAADRDWARAGVMAESSIETALARMNTSTTWRTDYAGGGEFGVGQIGNAKGSFKIVDPADGDLEKYATDSAKVYGYGRVGTTTRVFSVQANYRAPAVLDVLKYAVYGGVLVRASGATVSGAPLGSPSLNNASTLTANVHVGALTNTGTIVGEVRTGDTPLVTFSDGSLANLAASGVAINYNSLPNGGTIRRTLLSAASNPYGSTSSAGIYFIRVPAASVLLLRECRIVATLVVELGAGASIQLQDQINWDRPNPEQPTLVVYATAAATVQLSGVSGQLDEAQAGFNFNPPSTPYNGVSNSTSTDKYPCEIRGIIHVLGTLPALTIGSGMVINGTVICEGTVTLTGSGKVAYDPQVLVDPPPAYRTAAAGMSPVAGTWTWEVLP